MSQNAKQRPHILIVDDEPDLLELLELTLIKMGLDVTRSTSVAGACEQLTGKRFDLCLTDMRMPDGSGMHVVEHIASTQARRAGRRDDRLCVDRERGRRAEGRRVRLSAQAGVARRPAQPRQVGAEGPRRRRADQRAVAAAARPVDGDGARARPDHAAREERRPGLHPRRIRQRQGARRADAALDGPARQRSVHPGQLRRDSRDADGVRILRLSRRARSPAPMPIATASSRPRIKARCFWTKWPSCR